MTFHRRPGWGFQPGPASASMRAMTTTVRALVLACAVVAPVSAAELVVRDLALGVEMLPTSFSYTLTDPSGTRSGSDSFDSAYGAYVGTRWSFAGPGDTGGLLVGGDLGYATRAYANGGAYTTYGVRALAGWGWALHDRWTLQALVDGGVAAGAFELKGRQAFQSYSASGLQYTYAARLGVAFTVTERFLVEADAGWRGESSALSAGGTDLQLTGSGLCASVGLRYRFTSAPAPLE